MHWFLISDKNSEAVSAGINFFLFFCDKDCYFEFNFFRLVVVFFGGVGVNFEGYSGNKTDYAVFFLGEVVGRRKQVVESSLE